MPRIRILPDPLVNQIAAGEVVERPASVVKELLENALDAGATRVEIDLEGGGRRRIRLSDDGSGMDADDALLAFDRHATSKIAQFADLERVATLGFRGEALASIASVAKVELLTAERAGAGTRVRVEGGRVLLAEPATRPRGTTVDVRSLFWNVPARAKFLKTAATELRRAVEVAQGYVLARPDLHLVLRHDGRLLLEAVPAGSGEVGLRERVRALFGSELADRLVPLPGLARGADPFAAVGERSAAAETADPTFGLVGRPDTARGRRSFTFVNGRLLRDRQILATFYRAVRDEWRSEDFPALFLFLVLPPEDVDVNVHPQKAEVRLRRPEVLDRLYARFRLGLARARGEEPAGLRAPGGLPRVPLAWEGGVGGQAGGSPWSGPSGASGEVPPGWRFPQPSPRGAEGSSMPLAGVSAGPGATAAGAGEVHETSALDRPWGDGGGAMALLPQATFVPPSGPPAVPWSPLSGRGAPARAFRVLGQYKGTLILLEGPDGLYLVDQHVAHERILYERLRRDLWAETTPSQRLLVPALLELGPAEALRLGELAPALEACGFALEPLSGRSLALAAVPAALDLEAAQALLLALAGDEQSGRGDAAALRRALLDALAASLACKAAVKMHHPLGLAEMQGLISELFAAENPYACPHGRPTVLALSDGDLERRFGRRG
jgi:DNA mismatch repair protein MutL